MDWTVAAVVEATRGTLYQGNPSLPLKNISTDTRGLKAGDGFLALPGERYDGHDFIPGALSSRVEAVIVAASKMPLGVTVPESVAVIVVPDTLYALGELARYRREHYSIPLVGITGSNGKTSTKEMIAGILSRERRVLKNQGNFNNLIGVPLTLLTLDSSYETAVIEMGINVPGEMARLVEITDPTVGLITNVHPAHLEGLRSLSDIVEEKGKLWTASFRLDTAVVNLDDERLSKLGRTVKARTLTYALDRPEADVRLDGEVEIRDGESTFGLRLGGERIVVRLPVLGLHQVNNAVAAAAVAWGMGSTVQQIVEGLSAHQPVRQRMQVHRLKDGRNVIDDTYNANPASMMAAVRTLVSAGAGRPTIAVLGEMRELGPESGALHREVGRQLGRLGVHGLITLGAMGEEINQGAQEAGMPPQACRHAQTHAEAVAWLREACPAGAWVLVKGSRGMTMERVVEGILAE